MPTTRTRNRLQTETDAVEPEAAADAAPDTVTLAHPTVDPEAAADARLASPADAAPEPVTIATPASEPETDADAPLASLADTALDTVTIAHQDALQTLESAHVAVFSGFGRVQREVADFVSERIRHDMQAGQAFLRCKTLPEVRAVQSEFLRAAVDQYATEATRLVRLGGEMVSRSLDRRAD